MKGLKTLLVAFMVMLTTTVNAMTYSYVRNEALRMSNAMARELRLSRDQYRDVFAINLDYMRNVNNKQRDVIAWKERNKRLDRVLTRSQYREYKKMKNLYHPKHHQELIKRDAAHHQHHHARHKHHLNHYYD